ncbi:MAG: lipoate--protein ligase [Desulfosoma sp.]
MIGILSEETDAAWNLAAEEYLMEKVDGWCFLVYRNAPSVVVGRNQNAAAEADVLFTCENGIPVLRRISGGGAVYHDMGNVNYAFIEAERERGRRSFEDFMEPVAAFLRSVGAPVQKDGRSDLGIDGLKISGNAQCRRRGKILHHGTVLFDADLSLLQRALRPSRAPYADKAVASVRRPVTNVRPFLKRDMNADDFMERLFDAMQRLFGFRRISLTQADREAVSDGARRKYKSWEWNFGASPPYRLEREAVTPGGILRIRLDVVRGKIENALLEGASGNGDLLRRVQEALRGVPHLPQPILAALEKTAALPAFSRAGMENLLAFLF